MPMFLLPVMAVIGRVPSFLWKYLAVALAIGVVFLYGYNKGKGVERERCEAAAKIAQTAADTQDAQAARDGLAQEKQVNEALTQQKKVDDERIANLEKELSKPRPKGASAPCVYDKSTADPDDAPRRVRNK